MLVLTRKQGEGLKLGNDIEITVIKLDDNTVKLAIKAPKEIKILRSELYDEVKEENRKSIDINMELLKSFGKET